MPGCSMSALGVLGIVFLFSVVDRAMDSSLIRVMAVIVIGFVGAVVLSTWAIHLLLAAALLALLGPA